MTDALTLTAIGMAVVFVALGLICGAIVVLGWLDRRMTPAVAAPPPTGGEPVGSTVTPAEEAAVHAALAHHLGRNPESFRTRIKPMKEGD